MTDQTEKPDTLSDELLIKMHVVADALGKAELITGIEGREAAHCLLTLAAGRLAACSTWDNVGDRVEESTRLFISQVDWHMTRKNRPITDDPNSIN